MQQSRVGIFRNTHPIHPIRPQTHIFGHFGLFRCCMNFGAKQPKLVQLMPKFVPQCRVGIFRNERT
jgi:hypothetical protein